MENLSLTKQRDELLPLLMNGQVNFDLLVRLLINPLEFGNVMLCNLVLLLMQIFAYVRKKLYLCSCKILNL